MRSNKFPWRISALLLSFLLILGGLSLTSCSETVADVLDIAKDVKRDHRNAWGPGSEDLVVSSDVVVSRWYIRAKASLEEIRKVRGEIQPLARSGAPAGEAAFLTGPMTQPELSEKLAGIQTESLFRVLD